MNIYVLVSSRPCVSAFMPGPLSACTEEITRRTSREVDGKWPVRTLADANSGQFPTVHGPWPIQRSTQARHEVPGKPRGFIPARCCISLLWVAGEAMSRGILKDSPQPEKPEIT